MHWTTGRNCVVLIAILALAPGVSFAVDCTVPDGSYPTVQSAINDVTCTTINLSDQSYPESILIYRSVTIAGPPGLADIAGFVKVQGGSTVVQMNNVMVQNGCQPLAFEVMTGSQFDSTRLEVIYQAGDPCPELEVTLFADGFESGNTSAWSVTVD